MRPRPERARTAYGLSDEFQLQRPRIQGWWALDKSNLGIRSQRESGGRVTQRAQCSPPHVDE